MYCLKHECNKFYEITLLTENTWNTPLTPTTNKIAFAVATQVVPLPLVFEYSSSTVLTFKVVRLTWFPVTE